MIVPVAAVAETVAVSRMFGSFVEAAEDDPARVMAVAETVPVNVGDADNAILPEPVTFCPSAVATPVPKEVIPVPPEATGRVPVVRAVVEEAYIAPFAVNEVSAVPPDAVGNVPVVSAEVEEAYTAPLAVNEVRLVPPFAVGSVPVTPLVREMLVTVLLEPLIVLFVSVWVPASDTGALTTSMTSVLFV